MSVYVDEFKHYGPTKIRCFKAGSSHMTADTLEELHALAARIGLQREWFQPHWSAPHYDLTESKREKALAAGAVFVPAREQARKRVEARNSAAPSTTGDVDLSCADPGRNMYGCWPCPRCKSEYRASYTTPSNIIRCECGHVEPATFVAAEAANDGRGAGR